MIVGTNTPLVMLALRGWTRLSVLAVIWGGAVAGILARLIWRPTWRPAPRWLITSLFIALGWAALLVLPQLLPDVLCEQFRQASTLGEGHYGHQAAVRHQIRVIEHGTGPREAMRQSHLRGVLSAWADGSLENYHHPSSEGTFRVAAPETTPKSPVN
jgi:hypothetical protein